MQIVGYVLPCRSYSFVCTVHHLIIIIVQTYLNTLNLYNACQIYFVECVSKIKHIVSVIHYTICGAVCFQFTHFPCDDWENIYILCLIIIIKSEVWTTTHCLWNNGVRCMSFYILMYDICMYTVIKLTFYQDGSLYWFHSGNPFKCHSARHIVNAISPFKMESLNVTRAVCNGGPTHYTGIISYETSCVGHLFIVKVFLKQNTGVDWVCLTETLSMT